MGQLPKVYVSLCGEIGRDFSIWDEGLPHIWPPLPGEATPKQVIANARFTLKAMTVYRVPLSGIGGSEWNRGVRNLLSHFHPQGG